MMGQGATWSDPGHDNAAGPWRTRGMFSTCGTFPPRRSGRCTMTLIRLQRRPVSHDFVQAAKEAVYQREWHKDFSAPGNQG